MAAGAKDKARQYAPASMKLPIEKCKVPTFRPGDVIRVQLFDRPAEPHPTLLLRAERCDDQHRILFGTIVSESFGLSRALNRGAKLAVAYHLVRENVHIVSFRGV